MSSTVTPLLQTPQGTFRVGDVVRLRGGHQEMTIVNLNADDVVGPICAWHDAQGVGHQHAYPEQALERVDQ